MREDKSIDAYDGFVPELHSLIDQCVFQSEGNFLNTLEFKNEYVKLVNLQKAIEEFKNVKSKTQVIPESSQIYLEIFNYLQKPSTLRFVDINEVQPSEALSLLNKYANTEASGSLAACDKHVDTFVEQSTDCPEVSK